MTTIPPLITRLPEKGVDTSVYLVSSPEVQDVTVAKDLWDFSAEIDKFTDNLLEKECSDLEWEVGYLLFLFMFIGENAWESGG
jgi:hypothetical protein